MSILKKCIAAAVSLFLSFGVSAYFPDIANTYDMAISAEAADLGGFVTKKDSAGRSYIASYKGKGGEITIPSDVSYIGEGAFKDNLRITGVVIPEKCRLGIGDNAFFNCINLKKVTFVGDEKYIGDNAFFNCTSLKSVVFEKGDAYIEYIGEAAFRNCFALSSVQITSGTKKIYDYAFENCLELDSVSIPENVEQVGRKAFGYMYNSASDTHIIADEDKEEYISYNEVYDGELIEWYAQKVQKPITIIAVKNSAAEKYAKSNKIRCIRVGAVEKPAVTAKADTNQIILEWKRIRDAESYRVDVYDANSERFVKLRASNATKIIVPDLNSDTEYIFRVTSLKGYAGKYYDIASSSNIYVKTSKENENDDNTVRLIAKGSVGTDHITLTWNIIKNADIYRVYMYDKGSKSYELYGKSTGKALTIENLKGNTEYKFYVAAAERSGNDFVETVKSDIITLKTDKAAVKKKSAENVTVLKIKASAYTDSIVLEWDTVKEADKYIVYLYNPKTGRYEKFKQSKGKKCELNDLASGTKYKLYVSALKLEKGSYVEIMRSKTIEISTAAVNRVDS